MFTESTDSNTEEVAEAGEAEAAGAVVVVEAAREVAPPVVLTFLT